jgi:hypothetical protein
MSKISRVKGAIDELLGALRSKERKVGGLASGIEIQEKALRAISGGVRVVDTGGYGTTCEGVCQGVSDMTRVDDR